MPYDSATGSSGPAHQACEYGVPIVCANIADFERMAEDEDMAISFYQRGEPADLAEKLVAILESPEQQQRMAEHNFSAAIRMTMPSVVRQYLRWFELAQYKRRSGASPALPLVHSADWPKPRQGFEPPLGLASSWSLQPDTTPVVDGPRAGARRLRDTG
jgi:hypothetical protein